MAGKHFKAIIDEETCKKMLFAELVKSFDAGALHIASLASLSILIFGYDAGIKRFCDSVPYDMREGAARRALQIKELSFDAKANLMDIFIG